MKKKTRKQLLRLVAMILFISMVITSTAPSYAAGDFGETSEESSGSEGGGDENGEPLDTTPATTPEDTTNSSETTNQDSATPDEPAQSPNQGDDAGKTPGKSDDDIGSDGSMPSDGTNTASGSEPSESIVPDDATGTESDEKSTISPDTELDERVISSTASGNVKIDGLLPEGATVSAYPAEIDLDGQEVLAAYDITILDKDGQEYKITDSVTVTISGISDLKNVSAKSVNVYHMVNEYAKAERISDFSVSGDSVTFTANSFSIYAVTVSTTMTMDDAEGGRTVDPSYDSYISINDDAKEWNVTLTKADGEDFDPNGKYSREIEFTFKLTYKFNNDIHPDINRGAYFQLPDYLEFMDKVNGEIIDEDENGKIVGRYEVVGDKIYFTFTDSDWLERHKANMDGNFTFNVKVSSSASENESHVDVVFPGDSDTTTIYFEEGKVEGNKTGKLIEGGKYIEYTITLEVKEQDVTNVTLTDILGDGLTFVNNSFTLTRISDEGNVELKDVSISGSTCTITIDKLEIGKYELKYRVEVDHDQVGENAKNQVTWKWDGGEEKNPKNANVHIQKHQVGKYGQVEGDRIKWQIAVTPDQLESVAGTTIVDTLGDGLEYEGKLYIYKSDNIYWYSEENLVAEATIDTNSNSFEYTFTDGKDVKYEAGAIYFIVYYTKITDTGLGKYTNRANDKDDEEDGESYDVNYTPTEPSLRSEEIVKKEGTVVSEGNPAEEVIHWTITIEPSKYVGDGDKIGNLTLKDKNPNYGYNWFLFVEDSLTVEYEGIGEAPAGDYKLVWNEDNISFTIVFTKEFTKESPNIIVSYTAKLTEGKQFSGWVDNQVVSEYEIDGDPRKETDDGKVQYTPNSGSGSGDSEFSKTGEMNGLEVEWTVVANYEGNEAGQAWGKIYLNGEYTIEDILPPGMTYVPGSASYAEDNWLDINEELEFHNIDPISDENGKLVFKFTFDNKQSFIILKYKTIIDDLEAGESVGDSSYSFTNSADITGEGLSGSDSDTVTYTKKILDKYGTLSSGYYNSVDYTILINYDAVDLLDDGDWLTLVDTLDPNTALDLDSLKVTDSETEEDITDSCQISYDSSGKRGKLILTVPDGRALIVTYRVDVFGDPGEKITITNDAELRGVKSSETSSENTVIIRSSSAGAGGESAEFKIRKIDKNNIRHTLEGAKFNLYKWSGIENDFVKVNSDPLTTDDKGDITFGVASDDDESNASGKLYTDTLYMYEEVDAPNGYIKDTTKHYFILKGKGFNEINLTELEQKYGEIACYDNGITVYVANEANPTYGFSVEKTDEDGKPLDGAEFTLTKVLGEEDSTFPRTVSTDNGRIDFTGLLPGTYELTETNAPNGYKRLTETYTIIIDDNGNITYKKGNVTLSDLSGEGPLVIENEKITGNAEFSVVKTYENWDGETFEFELRAEIDKNNPQIAPMPEKAVGYSQRLELHSNIKTTFGKIEFDTNGDYYYTIKEVKGDDSGIRYDVTRYYIRVHVADNNEANPTKKDITIYVTTDENGWNSENWTTLTDGEYTAKFTNVPTAGSLKVTKTISGVTVDETWVQENGSKIEFTVYGPAADGNKGPERAKFNYAQMNSDENGIISKFIQDLPVGEYTVEETYTGFDNYRITTTYQVTENGTVIVGSGKEGVAKGNVTDEGTLEIDFTNEYTLLTGSLTVNKTITGLDLTKLTSEQMEAIKFVVMTDPEDEETIVGEPFTLDKFKDLGNGKYQYMLPNDLPYGTYYVKEIGGAMSGYTHIVTVNGETASSGSVTIGDGNTTPEVSVVNIYRKHGELTVTKTFDGDALTETQENQIKFTVYGPASNESNGPKIAEFTYADIVVAGGSMTFTNLAEGTYTVVESNQEIGGYTVTTEYSVGESAAEQNATYTVEIHDQDKIQVDFVNTYRRTTTGLEVTKIWNDSENQDGIRPQTIDVVLISSIDGESWSDVEQTEDIKNPITLPDDGDVWSYTWSKLPTHDVNGNPIKYSVREELPENSGYAGAVSLTGNAKEGYKVEITNTHETEKTNVKVVKNWNKNGYENLQLPESITVTLYAQVEGGAKETKPEWTVTLPEDGKWEHTFENLPVYEDGKKITYTVSEVEIDQYDSTTSVAGPDVDGNYTITITNTYNPELIDIPVEKVWDDEDNQDGIRPTEITVELLADNDPTGETIKLGNGNWSGIFENLRKYGDDGHEIQYTVKELEIQLPDGYTGAGYSSSVSKDSTGKITITNTHTLATTKVEGKKTWDDDNDRDHQRPTEIEIKLVAKIDGTTIEDLCQTKKLSKTGNEWEYSFDGLPVYRDGKKITYEVIEVSVNEGYTLTQIGDEKNSYELINKHTPGETSVSVVKNWDDANDQDDVRPDSIWVKLYKKVAGGDWKEVTASTSIPNPVELSGNNWSYTWTGLPEKEDGQTIEYWVKETTVPTYYTSDEEKDTVKEGNVITITNHHKPEETSVDVEKKWENGGYTNINIQYPDSVYVRLYAQTADDQEPWTKDEWRVELSKTANDWKHTFSNLPVRKNGKLITYTIVEETVDGPYAKPSINGSATAGFTVTNTYAPQTTEVDVTKVWEDNNDQDGIRPSSIRVQLKANGSDYGQSVELNNDNGWYYQWTNLPTVDGKGDKIDYTVEETGVPSGYTSRTTGGWDADTNSYKYTITNTYTPQQTSVKVVKAWDDVNNQDGKRPASITVQLYADGVAKDDSVTLNSANGWTYTWTDLPMNADGEQIDYTVVESGVPDGYTTSDPAGGFNAQTNQYEFTITNTHTPAVTDIEVIKNWIDDDDNDGLRPTSIKVQLKADGTVVREQLELKADSWSGKWENLPVYRNNGTRIIYTVEEVTVPGYSVEYDGGSFDEETGTYMVFTVTNTHEAGTTNVSVKKIWEDGNNQDGKRPTSITVQLYAGTVAQGDPITLNSANGWTYTWNNLPAKAGGQDIRYTVKEVTVPDGYSVEYAGGYNEATHTYELITITNVHTLETVNVSGTKTWNHGSNTDPNNQPDSITIRLYKETQSGGKQLVKTQEVKAPWSWNFTGLPKYENGEPITYSVEEDKVAGYTSDVDGYNVINTYDEQEETPSPTPGETSAPTETPVPTETPAPGETPVPTETPAPGETPVPSEAPTPVVTPVPEETPGPEEPEPTPDEDATPAPTGTPVVAPTATPTPEVLQPRRYQISGTEGMVLGARRGMDYAVLGMRRRPSTGDSVAMLWWLLSLFTALGGCITSGVMMMFGRKRE